MSKDYKELALQQSASPSLVTRFTMEKLDFEEYEDQLSDDESTVNGNLGPGNPFWKHYMRESMSRDQEILAFQNKNLDALLVFSGLFSAVLTAFLVEASKNLQPDMAQSSAETLITISAMLVAIHTGESLPNPPAPPSISYKKTSIWVNCLWFTSLNCTLGASLITLVLKQLLGQYKSALYTGPFREQALRRQFRQENLDRWWIPGTIEFLPVLLCTALGLFLVGLVVFLWPVNSLVAAWTLVTGIMFAIAYLLTTGAPLASQRTPFHSPILWKLLNSIRWAAQRARRLVRDVTHPRSTRAPLLRTHGPEAQMEALRITNEEDRLSSLSITSALTSRDEAVVERALRAVCVTPFSIRTEAEAYRSLCVPGVMEQLCHRSLISKGKDTLCEGDSLLYLRAMFAILRQMSDGPRPSKRKAALSFEWTKFLDALSVNVVTSSDETHGLVLGISMYRARLLGNGVDWPKITLALQKSHSDYSVWIALDAVMLALADPAASFFKKDEERIALRDEIIKLADKYAQIAYTSQAGSYHMRPSLRDQQSKRVLVYNTVTLILEILSLPRESRREHVHREYDGRPNAPMHPANLPDTLRAPSILAIEALLDHLAGPSELRGGHVLLARLITHIKSAMPQRILLRLIDLIGVVVCGFVPTFASQQDIAVVHYTELVTRLIRYTCRNLPPHAPERAEIATHICVVVAKQEGSFLDDPLTRVHALQFLAESIVPFPPDSRKYSLPTDEPKETLSMTAVEIPAAPKSTPHPFLFHPDNVLKANILEAYIVNLLCGQPDIVRAAALAIGKGLASPQSSALFCSRVLSSPKCIDALIKVFDRGVLPGELSRSEDIHCNMVATWSSVSATLFRGPLQHFARAVCIAIQQMLKDRLTPVLRSSMAQIMKDQLNSWMCVAFPDGVESPSELPSPPVDSPVAEVDTPGDTSSDVDLDSDIGDDDDDEAAAEDDEVDYGMKRWDEFMEKRKQGMNNDLDEARSTRHG